MKPIRLEFIGINSYSKKQVIDFEELTKRGFFGIFGKTGSGKSTILDAITLALYGSVSRNTKEYINSLDDKAYVCYEFEIGVGENKKRYVVDRKFKRTVNVNGVSETIGSKTTYIRLVEKVDNEEIILADKRREVDENIENIIGLSNDDFTRSVVLPQGKFNEFLKLSGVDRRNMLERIFNLEKYGSELNGRLNLVRRNQLKKIAKLKTRLEEYPDVTEDVKKQLEIEIFNLKEILDKEETKKSVLSIEIDKSRELIKLIDELDLYKEQNRKLILESDDFKLKTEKVESAEKATYIYDDIVSLDKENESLQKNNCLNEKKAAKVEKLKEEYKYLSDEFDKAEIKYNNLSEFKLKQKNYNDALELQVENEKLKLNNIEKENYISKIEVDKNSENKNLELLNEKIKQIVENKEKLKNDRNDKYEKLKIKRKLIEKELKEIENIKLLSDKEYNNLCSRIEKGQTIIRDLNKADNYIKNETEIKEKNNNKLKVEKKNLDEKVQIEKIRTIEKENLEKQIKEKQKELMIFEIQTNLKKGEICPICGGVFENVVHKINSYDFEDANKQLESLNLNLKKLELEKNKIEDNIKKLEFIILNSEKNIKNKIKEVKDENIHLNQLSKYEKIFTDLESSRKKEIEVREEVNKKKKINSETMILNISDLKQLETNFEKNYNIEDKKYNNLTEQINKSNAIIIDFEKNSAIVKSEINSNLNLIKINELKIKSVCGEKDPEFLEKEISEKILNIESNYKEIKLKKFNSEKEVQENSIEFTKIKERIELIKKNIMNLDKKIKSKLVLYKFESIEDVKKNFLELNEIENLKKEIKMYEEKRQTISVSINQLEKKIGNKTVDRALFKEQLIKEETLNLEIEQLKVDIVKVETNLEKLNEDLKKVKQTAKKLKEQEKKMDTINIMEKLLKGNKFVEYISKFHLKYIVMEASNRLANITNGRFSLEVNADSNFVMRDNFNGGIRRNVDTLSGGETFLTSLSLALALSSQIQLKGNAPLEFFFLDEGFGTLDYELLDVVIESLEKLHSDKMSVGIISHVEELRDRIPIKLIVETSEKFGGSRAKIEYS